MFYFSFDNKEEMFIRSRLEKAREPELAAYNSLLNIY